MRPLRAKTNNDDRSFGWELEDKHQAGDQRFAVREALNAIEEPFGNKVAKRYAHGSYFKRQRIDEN